MSAPNIVNVTAIYGKTTYATPANTSANVLLANSSGSGKVLKINELIAANADNAAPYSCTVAINTAADGSGTSYPIVSVIPVPANASLIVMDKTTSVYLEENKSIVVTSSTASKIAYTLSYDEIY